MKDLWAGGLLAMWMIAASGSAQTYVFRNVAGNAATYGITDGTNGNALFNGPAGVAVDGQGNLYVADQISCTIRKITPIGTNWVVTAIAGSANQINGNRVQDGTNSQALFNWPTGIVVDPSGNLFVADQFNNAIRKVTPMPGTTNWVVTTIAGQGPNTNGAVDGTNTAAQFNAPSGIAMDANGNLFVADQFNNEIRKMTPSGTNWIVTTIAGHAPPGKTGFADGTNTARFNNPTGLAVDTNGNVYVADEKNDAIRKLTPLGTNWVTTTIGGHALTSGTNNGSGTNALFYFPFSLAVDGKGSVFVADMDNNTIRIGFLPPAILNSAPPFGFDQGQFEFILTGPTGQLVVVEASSDLLAWVPIWTNTFGPGQIFFADPQTAPPAPRFYRAQLP